MLNQAVMKSLSLRYARVISALFSGCRHSRLVEEAAGNPTALIRRSLMFKTASTLTAAALAMMMGLSTAQAGEMKKDTMMKKETMAGAMKKDTMMKKDAMGSEMKEKHAMGDKMKKDGMMGKKDDMMAKKDKMMGEKK
jgi:hypothetical protein